MGNEKKAAISTLVNIFSGLTPLEIDQLVAEAKGILRWTREALKNLFDEQIQRLRDRGCPKDVVKMLIDQQTTVIEKTSRMTISDHHIPFLSVIPFELLSLKEQMEMVWCGKWKRGIHLNPEEIYDVIETSDSPYYIFDVEDGKDMLKKSPGTAEKLIKQQNRFCLVVCETIGLIIQTDVLSRHHVVAAGSRYQDDNKVPYFCLFGVGRRKPPRLYWVCSDSESSKSGKFGSASCGSR